MSCGRSGEQREALTFSGSITSLPGSGCPGTAQPGPCHPLPPQLEKGSLLRRAAGKAASMSHSPKTRCFARQQTRAALEPTLFRLRHPVHHPGVAAGPKVPGAAVRSSFIFSILLWEGWSESLGMTVPGDPEGKGFLRSHCWGGWGRDGAGEEPMLPPPSQPAGWYPCWPFSWGLPISPITRTSGGEKLPGVAAQAAGLIPAMAVGHGAQRWAAEGSVVISSPKPQAVPASVKCDRSWALAGPSKQAIFMK